jgi:hypothetical protein
VHGDVEERIMELPTLPNDTTAPVCRMLRTKNSFASYGGIDDIPWQEGESSTAVFWCLGTMETAGPDDGYAHPTACRAGRTCYRAAEE